MDDRCKKCCYIVVGLSDRPDWCELKLGTNTECRYKEQFRVCKEWLDEQESNNKKTNRRR